MPKYRSRATRASEANQQIQNGSEIMDEVADSIQSCKSSAGLWNAPTQVEYDNWTQDLNKAETEISNGTSEIESLADEMRSWEENTAEKFSQTSKYETVSATADTLESARDDLQNDFPELPPLASDEETWIKFAEELGEAAEQYRNAAEEADGCEFPGMRG